MQSNYAKKNIKRCINKWNLLTGQKSKPTAKINENGKIVLLENSN
jgi:hypothetical protein